MREKEKENEGTSLFIPFTSTSFLFFPSPVTKDSEDEFLLIAKIQNTTRPECSKVG